jgi:hypothetical protein
VIARQVPVEVTVYDRGFPATSRSNELAARLLDVISESDLKEFIAGLVAETGGNAGRRMGGDVNRALVESLMTTAARTLPALAVALDDDRRPAASVAAQSAARTFGVEAEGLSPEDRDFEIARRFVGFAQAQTARAARV